MCEAAARAALPRLRYRIRQNDEQELALRMNQCGAAVIARHRLQLWPASQRPPNRG